MAMISHDLILLKILKSSIPSSPQQKLPLIQAVISMAGAGGIEPTLTVLETVVLPLYEAPLQQIVQKQ